MKSYHFNTTVEMDGSVHLTGLPPQRKVEIVIMERGGPAEEMEPWLSDLRERHPFSKMRKEEILKLLRQTREIVWVEQHES